MSNAASEIFDAPLQKTQVWLNELMSELQWDDKPQKTFLALRTALHALRDRLTVEEAAELLGLSRTSTYRLWTFVRAWVGAQLGRPRGVEPLCAAYGPACGGGTAASLAAGDLRAIGFHRAVRVGRLPLEAVRRLGNPARLFFNINTADDLARADAL